MALPLDPATGLFPETYVEAFTEAPELEALADEVLATFDEFEPIQTAMREAGLRIAYAWETKPFDPANEDIKPHTIAKVTKASPLWRHLAGTELAIQFRQAFWAPFTDAQRRAVIHHELTHIEVDEPDDQGRIHLALRKHDVEDFTKTMRRFGPIIPGRAGFVKAFLDWQHEQDTPEPTPLRSVDVTSPEFEEALRQEAPEGWEVGRGEDGTIHVSVNVDDALLPEDVPLLCVGGNHVPGHTVGCPRFVPTEAFHPAAGDDVERCGARFDSDRRTCLKVKGHEAAADDVAHDDLPF